MQYVVIISSPIVLCQQSLDCSLFTFIVPLYPSGSIETATHFQFLILQVFPILMTKENLQVIWLIYIKIIRAESKRKYKHCQKNIINIQIQFISSLLNCMPGVVACLRALCVYVLMCFACLRAYMLFVLACVLVMMKCFIFLHVCVLGVLFYLIYFTFQYLNLKFRTEKNLCALLILICILIPTYKTI